MLPSRPNFLFLMADQWRHDFLGNLAEFVKTPNLDWLANQGTQFTHCCTNSPLCAPARIGLASGIQPFRLGALNNNVFLPANTKTYYQRLRDAGYRVGCVGKLDLAKPDRYNGRFGDRPRVFQWGFTHPEECEGKMHAGSSPTPIGPYTFYLQQHGLLKRFFEDYHYRRQKRWDLGARGDSVLPYEHIEDVYIGRQSVKWLENIPDDFPFHLFVSFVGPHDPFDPPAELFEKYRNVEMPPAIDDDLAGKPEWIRQKQRTVEAEVVQELRQRYCAFIELIDHQIGKILETLRRRKLLENTYIVFTSDHGEMLGDHGLWKKEVAYEGALRIPLMLFGPGIPAGKQTDALVELFDLNPTVCELAGLPTQEKLEARSLVPVLSGQQKKIRDSILAVNQHFACIRTERYKLIRNHNSIIELYDLVADPGELNNITETEKKIVGELLAQLSQRLVFDPQWK